MKLNYIHLVLVTIPFLLSCSDGTKKPSSENLIDTLRLAKDIETLASDEFLGRMPFTEGETRTIDFLTASFKQIGLKPANVDSYTQDVPLVEITPTPEEVLRIRGGKQDVNLQLGTEFVAFSERVAESVAIESSEMVFAGFGIVAPEYGWNDYEGLDVDGKTVIVLVNDPGFGSNDSTFFKGQTMTYYGRWTYKYEEAARQGAAGLLIIHETAPAGYPWVVVQNGWTGAQLYLERDPSDYLPAIQGWITREAAIKIFESSEVDMKKFVEKSRSNDFKPILLGLNASVGVTSEIERNVSKNVIGKIEGKTKPDEYIIYSAHWDHLGIGPVIEGDSIYNGAKDNASGTAALLEIARAFQQESPEPYRTVIFLLVTAEEQGLLGSKYYAEHPIYPAKQTIANINIDAMSTLGFVKDFTLIGYGQSELEDYAEEIAKTQNRFIQPDPDAEKGYFFRSDHFQFAKVGIPALYGEGKAVTVNGGEELAKAINDAYTMNRYHQPSDEFRIGNSDWQFGAMFQDCELFYQLGKKLANSDLKPEWKPGSEFKAIREASLK